MYNVISNPLEYWVALYIRLSKEDDSDNESASVSNQRILLQEFVKNNGLRVFDVYIDDGYSGTNFDRPDFQRMLQDIESKKINMVITKDLSRLGRDYILTGHYLERYFPEHQVRYISLLDSVDTGIENSYNEFTPFKSLMNDMYAKDISKKITSVKRNKSKNGQFIGGKAPYGYVLSKTEKNTLEIDEEVAPLVRRMFDMAATGISGREIAIIYNNEKIPPPAVYANLPRSRVGPYSGLWSAERVTDMLKNQTYIGNMVQGKTYKVNYKSTKTIRKHRDDWTVVEDTHPPLVDKKTFKLVQEQIKSRAHTRVRKHDYLLKGLLHCQECGYPLGVLNRKLSGGREELYTVCRTYQRFTNAHLCTCHCTKLSRLTDAIVVHVKEHCMLYMDRDELKKTALRAITDEEKQKLGKPVIDISQLQMRRDKLSANMDRMYTDLLEGRIDQEQYDRIHTQMKKERDDIQMKMEALASMADHRNELPKEDKQLEHLINLFLDTVECNRGLLVRLVDKIEVTEMKEIFIHYKFRQLNSVQAISGGTAPVPPERVAI